MRSYSIAALIAIGFFMAASECRTEAWNLPCALNDSNSKITFEVDSTWHMVHGKTNGLRGKAWLLDPNDPKSIRAELSLPVASFDTDSKSRNERLQEVMASEHFPEVKFNLTSVTDICDPDSLADHGQCPAHLVGDLIIRDHSKPVDVLATVTKTGDAFSIDGKLPFQWEEFGVEDPSILVARVDKTVEASFRLNLHKATSDIE